MSSAHDKPTIRSDIDGVSIDELVSKHGSPLFVFSERALRRQFRRTHAAFTARYANTVFGWSYKTNYLAAICELMHQEGALAEVVSQMEYEKAQARGITAENIIYNGPHKPMPMLERAVHDGATINIDHLEEVHDLEAIAARLNRQVKVGIRLNLDAGIQPQWSRFGFNLETGQALEAVKRIAEGRRLIVNGLHCHIGTSVLDPTAYAREVEKMVALGYEIQKAFGFSMEYLDIGGGFPSSSRAKGSDASADTAAPAIEEFAEQISRALSRCLRPDDFPRLIIESGRALVDDAGFLITSIVAAKRLADGTRAYVADAGVNLLFTSLSYKLNMELDREVPGDREHSVVCGPLCMNIDAIDEGTALPPLTRGTRLVVSPVGAYNVTQWMQFIQYRPAIVLVGPQGQVDVIRQAEDLSDIERRERLPERLKKPIRL